jgi:hypothetical protein
VSILVVQCLQRVAVIVLALVHPFSRSFPWILLKQVASWAHQALPLEQQVSQPVMLLAPLSSLSKAVMRRQLVPRVAARASSFADDRSR